jgi:uncharacterized membrane protein (DUF106 family)
MDLLADLINALEPLTRMPLSAPFIVLVSVSLALLSIFATKKFTDVDEMKEKMKEIREWQAKMNKARSTMDPVLLNEVMAQQQRILKLNQEVMGSRMKPCCVTYLPIIIVFFLLSSIYGSSIVAIIPFNVGRIPFFEPAFGVTVPGGFGLQYFYWYFLASLGLGSLLRRAFGQDMM